MRPSLAALALILACALPAAADPVSLEACGACHGPNGTSSDAAIPSLGGQPHDFVVNQLFMFREKQRVSEAMNGMAAGMSDDDLHAYADAVGKLPAAVADAGAADPALADRVKGLVAKHRCASCHGADFSGKQQAPRLAGQHEAYLADALRGYKSSERPALDGSMNEVAAELGDADIRDLAAYLAHPAAR